MTCRRAVQLGEPDPPSITLIAGVGVDGDAHSGKLVQHTYLVRKDATQPNLRQVHLMPAEFFDHLAAEGYVVGAGELGENITTRGIDLLALPTGTVLRIGEDAVVELTGLRNPCRQIDDFRDGLMGRLRYRDEDGSIVRIAGVMGVVVTGGVVRPGSGIETELPEEPHAPLEYIANSHEPVQLPGSPR